MTMKDPLIHAKDFSKFILIDDDELTNILNKKIIQSVLPDMAIEIFIDIENK